VKVNTFIVGAPKAGTTSLHYYLQQHPDVCMSEIKEPNYFTAQEVVKLYYDVSPVNSEDWYHSIFAEPTRKVIGEGSVSYLFYPEVAQKIYEYNPEARILIILRNPVQRAFSHYLMDCRLGLCDISFEEILDKPSKYPHFYLQFVELGMYNQQINRYLEVFGHNQVKVMFYDDLKTDANLFIEQVFSFLDLSSIDVNMLVKNKFKQPSSKIISKLYQFKWMRTYLNIFFPKGFLLKIKSVMFKDSKKPILDPSIKRKLSEIYKNDVVELSKLLSKDLSPWYANK
tara:strand:+ start:9132 stop:9983 length:852 start_codon:yes stop_codon:yes gene_type:complete